MSSTNCAWCGSNKISDASVPSQGISCIGCASVLCLDCFAESVRKHGSVGDQNPESPTIEIHIRQVRDENPHTIAWTVDKILANPIWTMPNNSHNYGYWSKEWGGFGMTHRCLYCEGFEEVDDKFEQYLDQVDVGHKSKWAEINQDGNITESNITESNITNSGSDLQDPGFQSPHACRGHNYTSESWKYIEPAELLGEQMVIPFETVLPRAHSFGAPTPCNTPVEECRFGLLH